MNRIAIKIFPFCFLFLAFLFPGILRAHTGKATAVMKELARYHAALLKDPDASLDTGRLVQLLQAGGDSKQSGSIFAGAVSDARALGLAKSASERLEIYARLTQKLSLVHGFHDTSGTHLYYCPMLKKYWIAQEDTVQNPYDLKMRSCGERKSK